jgi:hypothetical protein
MTQLPVPVLATATKINSSADQQTPRQSLLAADVLAVHVLTHLTASADEGMQAMAWARTAGKLVRLTKGADVRTLVTPTVFNPATNIDS